ncbi:MAG: TetR/AcrR family transcriptional regulator [Chitinophagaceae bacterium]|jgi:AcrR family transcriptional regulator
MTKDEITKSAIIEAAQKLFQQFGLAKTTMEDIAKAIGKGKSSLYYYYATKEDIFQAVVDKEKENIEQNIVMAIGKEDNAEEKLRAFAISKYRALRKRQLLYKIMTVGFSSESACIFSAIKQRYNETEESILKGIIVYGIRQGAFDQSYLDRIDIITKVCTNMLRGMQLEISFGTYKGSASDIIDETVDFISKGLKTRSTVLN